jgi:hypothetical protein
MDLEALVFQHADDVCADEVVVLDDEHGNLVCHGSVPACGSTERAGRLKGCAINAVALTLYDNDLLIMRA